MPIATYMNPQQAETFLVSQATLIEKEVYEIQYPSIRYHEIVPVDTQGGPWVPSVTFFSLDFVGAAAWFNGRATDIPNADVVFGKQETPVKMAGIGYRYDLEELAQAMMVGRPLSADKARAARMSSEMFIDQASLFGDTTVAFTGIFNNPYVTISQAAATGNTTQSGGGTTTQWVNKTPQQILADVNSILTTIWTTTNTVELADTLLLPLVSYSYIVSQPLNNVVASTILDFIQEKNIYSATTGRRLLIRPMRGLDTAGAGGVGRMMAYMRDPSVVKMHLPMPYEFLKPWQVGPILWEVPGIFRFGGVDVRRPGACRYVDGV